MPTGTQKGARSNGLKDTVVEVTVDKKPAAGRKAGAKGADAAEKGSGTLLISLPKPNLQRALVTLVGTSPLIVNKWSVKAREQMLAKQTQKAQTARAAKVPEDDYQNSLYRMPDGGYGFPALAFKNAAVDACSQIAGITKVLARGAFHVIPDDAASGLVRVKGTPRMHEAMVRVGMGTADIRFRGEFPNWSVTLTIHYNANVLSAEQLANLLMYAGFAVGVGEWRPERNGVNGMFELA